MKIIKNNKERKEGRKEEVRVEHLSGLRAIRDNVGELPVVLLDLTELFVEIREELSAFATHGRDLRGTRTKKE